MSRMVMRMLPPLRLVTDFEVNGKKCSGKRRVCSGQETGLERK